MMAPTEEDIRSGRLRVKFWRRDGECEEHRFVDYLLGRVTQPAGSQVTLVLDPPGRRP